MRKTLCMAAAYLLIIPALAEEIDLQRTPAETSPMEVSKPVTAVSLREAEGHNVNFIKGLEKFDASIKYGGYIMTQFTATDQQGVKTHSNFNLRLVRLYLNGYAFKDFYYRLQMEINGQPGEDSGPRIIDAFVEWQRFDELRVKIGEFKRSFGFENPMAPLTIGHGAYSQATTKFLFNDRNGAHSTGGRDLGIQLQGDFFPASDGHKWLHYQVGLFNGQGINHSDKDNHKDLIGGLWISPVKKLRVGGFGWNGKYTNEKYNAADTLQLQQVHRVRWGVGVDYASDWVFRAEYYSSVGGVVKNYKLPHRSDAWYATVGAPVTKNIKVYAKWDCYRDNRAWNSLKQIYGLSANWWLGKNFLLQANYNLTSDRSTSDRYYNGIDLQFSARF